MTRYKIIPVAYRQFKDVKGWLVSEFDVATHKTEEVETAGFFANKKENKIVHVLGGTETLLFFLNRGWQIEQVQQAPMPGCDDVPGAVLFQYLLSKESKESEE